MGDKTWLFGWMTHFCMLFLTAYKVGGWLACYMIFISVKFHTHLCVPSTCSSMLALYKYSVDKRLLMCAKASSQN